MSAYIITMRTKTHSDEGMQEYQEVAARAPAEKLEVMAWSKHGHYEVLEGEDFQSVVVIRFPTLEDAREWYFSDAYQEAIPHRWKGSEFQCLLVDGMD